MGVENHCDEGVHVETRRCGGDRHGWSREEVVEALRKKLNSKWILKIEPFFRTLVYNKERAIENGAKRLGRMEHPLTEWKALSEQKAVQTKIWTFSLRYGIDAQA